MRPALLLATLALLVVAPAAAQDEGQPPDRKKTPIPTEGFWPTRLMMERLLARAAEEIAKEYDMDDEQRRLTEKLLNERLIAFMDENRGEIQTLMNQFFEAQLSDEAPTPEDVAMWSGRALPLFGEFSQVVDEMTDSMRDYLTDDQQSRLDVEKAAFHAGLTLITNKLSSWSEGYYDPESEWVYPGPERRRREKEEEARMQSEMSKAREQAENRQAELAAGEGEKRPRHGSMPASAPLDEWARYTQDFVRRYDLNDEQQQKAQAFLRAKQDERDGYLERKKEDIADVTRQAAEAKTDEERQSAKQAADRLDAPVERMFQQLKEKLDTLPTRAQRQQGASKPAPDAEEKPASRPTP